MDAIVSEELARLKDLWKCGYSIAELWGISRPVQRSTSDVDGPHCLLWGILGIVEQQVSRGMGHRYARERLSEGVWLAVGYLAPRSENSELTYVPRFDDAKFGRKESAIGDGTVKYVDTRIVHVRLVEDMNRKTSNGNIQ